MSANAAPAYKIVDHTYDVVVVGAGGSGLRHLVMDIGAGFEIRKNKFWAMMTLAGSTALTALLWLYIGLEKL